MTTILYAEDKKIQRKSLTILLETYGYQVHAVSNGQEALDYLRRNPVDLLLTDNGMPIMSGLELLARAREFNCKKILYSADYGLEKDAKEAGADAFAKKLEPVKTLLETIKELTQGVEAK